MHTDHTDLQDNFIKASRDGVTTGCALGKDRARELSLSAQSSPRRRHELKLWMTEDALDALLKGRPTSRTPSHPLPVVGSAGSGQDPSAVWPAWGLTCGVHSEWSWWEARWSMAFSLRSSRRPSLPSQMHGRDPAFLSPREAAQLPPSARSALLLLFRCS